MAALDFPASPTDGQTYTANGVTFVWSAADTAWKGQGSQVPLSNSQRVIVAEGNDNSAAVVNGTWTKPAGLKFLQVECWGGGASGIPTLACTASQVAASGGGGGGGYCKKLYKASDLAATEAYVVGFGGASDLALSTAGGNTTFKGMTANGAGGGNSAAAAIPNTDSSYSVRGLGGGASGGDVNIPGSDGGGGRVFGGYPEGGTGGAGGGGGSTATVRVPATSSQQSRNGLKPGGGGGGIGNRYINTPIGGSAGAGGRIVFTEYYTENDTVGGGGGGGDYLPLSGGTLTGELIVPDIAMRRPVLGDTTWMTWENEFGYNEYAWRMGDPASLALRRYDGLVSGAYKNLIVISPTTGADAEVDIRSLLASEGVRFPASQVVSADPNTLDDSERGNFTPAVVGTTAAGSGTYTFRDGRYTKIGNKVFFELIASWTAHTGTGNIRISGLPFASIVGSWGPVVSIHADSLTFSGQLSATIPNGQVYVSLATITTNAASGAVAMDTSATLNIAGHYTAA